MRSVSVRLADLDRVKINLGFAGENEHTHVLFDCKKAFDQYPNATPFLIVTPPRGDIYPAVVTRDGDIVEWVVTDSDLIYHGNGKVQLQFKQGEIIMKSYEAMTSIAKSSEPTGTVPTPIQNWITQANAILAAIPDDINAALAAAKASGQFDGVGIASIAYKSTAGLVDTYTITLTDGNTYDFTVTNGTPGQNGVGIQSIAKTSTVGLVDTYTITLTNGQTYPFTVTNGQNGVEIDDTTPANNKVFSSAKVAEELTDVKNEIHGIAVTPEMFGAKGDGETDDSQAVQDAVDAGYNVRFDDNKTYYIASQIDIDHDCHVYGGLNTIIKTKTPTGGVANNGIVVNGERKKVTTLTSNYTVNGATDNAGNRFKLSDMADIKIGDVMVITAKDQYYSLTRQYYYLGATLLISDKDDEYIYTSDCMPFDIENTQYVEVEIYDAPTVIIENLEFKSDTENPGHYIYCLSINHCKNAIIRNCTISEMDNGLMIGKCVNALVDNVNISKTPEIGSGVSRDHYAISIYSSTNTLITRVLGEAANSCVNLSGDIPNINTRITYCNLFGTNRTDGLGLHENAYNTVVEDCVIGGAIAYGTILFNRCRFVQPRRIADSTTAIIYRGSHNEKWSRIKVRDCEIEGQSLKIIIDYPRAQTPISSFNHVIGSVEIENCYGGMLQYVPSVSATVLSNNVKNIILKNWKNCYEIYHTTDGIAEFMLVENCSFIHSIWINAHNNQLITNGIQYIHLVNEYPKMDKMYIDLKGKGHKYYLPEGIDIAFSASDQNVHYVVCGKNVASSDPDDYTAGSISGTAGNALTRNVTAGRIGDVGTDASDNIVITCSGTSTITFYPKCMLYVDEISKITFSCKLKNTGETDGSKFRMSIAVVDADTGLVLSNNQASAVQATSDGAAASITRSSVPANSLVQFYIQCNSSILNSETTLEELMISVVPADFDVLPYEAYNGKNLDGDGTIESIEGINNIMASTSNFNAKYKVNYLENG